MIDEINTPATGRWAAARTSANSQPIINDVQNAQTAIGTSDRLEATASDIERASTHQSDVRYTSERSAYAGAYAAVAQFSNDVDYNMFINEVTVVTGPAPAYQFNILDIESDMRNVIAKVQAQRDRDFDQAAIAPLVTTALAPHLTQTSNVQWTTTSVVSSKVAQIPPAITQNIAQQTQQVIPTDLQDREAAYFGSGALYIKPYDRLDITV